MPYAEVSQHGFLGLSALGYVTYAALWVVQAIVFWRGMESIRKFIDFCGPAVYVVMIVLCGYLLFQAHFAVNLSLSDKHLSGWAVVGHHAVCYRARGLVLLRADAELR